METQADRERGSGIVEEREDGWLDIQRKKGK